MPGEWRGPLTAQFLGTRKVPGEISAVYVFLALQALGSALGMIGVLEVLANLAVPGVAPHRDLLAVPALVIPFVLALVTANGLRRMAPWAWWLAIVVFGLLLAAGVVLTVAVALGRAGAIAGILAIVFSFFYAVPVWLLLACRKRYFERKDSPG